ncbi:uncharacterized protein LOC131153282 [Malania oleifera]|uniref:uncharacterized protein LOC131153282 n=1 Tax=Malania oleifera TaxID=397392 RepID=UPI0025AE5AF0|nr:uncharacterized protein LOC131153282 [Malania oleifera]
MIHFSSGPSFYVHPAPPVSLRRPFQSPHSITPCRHHRNIVSIYKSSRAFDLYESGERELSERSAMVKIPVRFKRVMAAMGEEARGRLCESSGSEHSPAVDLSDLINSFIERDNGVVGEDREAEVSEKLLEREELESERGGGNCSSDSETTSSLRSLLGLEVSDFDDGVRTKLRAEAELALRHVGGSSSPDIKRRLMARLRERGFEAGICKSRWEKTSRFPAGTYEYIDVNLSEKRYIIELLLAGEFDIARPTSQYTSMLSLFPTIFVGEADDLKRVVRLMCTAVRESLKSADMHLPPWRRNGYMQSKWFGPYKRTTNHVPARKAAESDDAFAANRSVGFEALPAARVPYNCRDGSRRKGLNGLGVGHLAAALNGN